MKQLSTDELAELAGGGLRTVERLGRAWALAPAQLRVLVGAPDANTLEAWMMGRAPVPEAVLTRLGHLLGIYRALHTIFSDPERADEWIHRPNSAPLFRGDTALATMLRDPTSLQAVHGYLQAYCEPAP